MLQSTLSHALRHALHRTLHRTLRHSLLALALGAGSALALAAAPPTYHVEIDTSTFQASGFGSAGWLDLQFNPSNMGGPAATALTTHFSGAFDNTQPAQLTGGVTGSLASGFTFTNGDSYNDLFQAFFFGASIGFDVSFSGAPDGGPNLIESVFAVSVYDAAGTTALGNYAANGSLLQLSWTPPADAAGDGMVGVSVADSLNSSVSAVPEPSAWLMLLAGVAMVGHATRRRAGKVRRA